MKPNGSMQNPPPWRLAWVATIATIVALLVARAACAQYAPHDPHSRFHFALGIADDGIAFVGSVSLVLINFVAGRFVLMAWTALVGFLMWAVAFISVLICGETYLAVALMAIGSSLILLTHLHHISQLLNRRWARLLRDKHARRLLVLVLSALVTASITFMAARTLKQTKQARFEKANTQLPS